MHQSGKDEHSADDADRDVPGDNLAPQHISKAKEQGDGTDHFGTHHAVAHVADLDHRTVTNRLVKARPAAAGIKFGAGIEQRLVAANAVINTVGFGAVVFTRKRSLSALEPAHVVLLRIEHGLPFVQGFVQLFHGSASATEKPRPVAFPGVGWHV